MRIVALTTQRRGFASLVLQTLQLPTDAHIIAVFFEVGGLRRPRAWRRRFRKVWRIGVLGALNGARIRPWFRESIAEELGIEDLFDVACRAGVPIKTVRSLSSAETVEEIRRLDADLGIALGTGYLPRAVFDAPRHGMINVHHELLPEYRGAQPVIWQVYDGHAQTGFSIHRIASGLDQGDILLRAALPLDVRASLRDTVVVNYARSLTASVSGLAAVLAGFHSLNDRAAVQGQGKSYTTPTIAQFARMVWRHRSLRERARNELQSASEGVASDGGA